MFSTYYEKEVAVHQRVRRYFATGVKVSSIKEYEALFSKSNAAIETRKGLRKIFNQVCAKTDEQKARNGTDMPLSYDTRMVILRATRTVFIQAQKAGHTNLMRLQCRLSRSCVSSLMFVPRHIILVSLFFRTSFSMR